jgi:hypothetical protein
MVGNSKASAISSAFVYISVDQSVSRLAFHTPLFLSRGDRGIFGQNSSLPNLSEFLLSKT